MWFTILKKFAEENHIFVEKVIQSCDGIVLQSTVRKPSDDEIKEAIQEFRDGKCSHKIIRDEKGWMYDYRICAICEEGLGTV